MKKNNLVNGIVKYDFKILNFNKNIGAKEVHIRIASPALHFPCYMGINIPTKEELIANHFQADQLAQQVGQCSFFSFK